MSGGEYGFRAAGRTERGAGASAAAGGGAERQGSRGTANRVESAAANAFSPWRKQRKNKHPKYIAPGSRSTLVRMEHGKLAWRNAVPHTHDGGPASPEIPTSSLGPSGF